MTGLHSAARAAAVGRFPILLMFDDWIAFCKRAKAGIALNLPFPLITPEFIAEHWVSGYREIRRFAVAKFGLYDAGGSSLSPADFVVEGLALSNEYGELFWASHFEEDQFRMCVSAYMRIEATNGRGPQEFPEFEFVTKPTESVR